MTLAIEIIEININGYRMTSTRPITSENAKPKEDLKDLIIAMPKAELHLHIEGTLEPELFFKLAARNNIAIPYSSEDALRAAYQFNNLQSFLDIYYAGTKVLMEEQDFYDLTWAYLKKAKLQNVRHVEIFFDPQSHTSRGIDFQTVVSGISRALKDGRIVLNISSHLIMCFLRDLSLESAIQTLKQSIPYSNNIVAIGLDSAELNNPPDKFKEVYEEARKRGLLTVAHAGEEGSPEYIWQALDSLKAKRIDHGVRCLEDDKLVERLREEKIPLTVCPVSNVKLKVFKSLAEHPLKKMLEKKLCVSVNSDDPAYFGAYVNEAFIECQRALNLNSKDIYQLAKNSFDSSFISKDDKTKFIEELDKTFIKMGFQY